MSEAQITHLNIDDNESYRYTRKHWIAAGIDNFVTAPGQNPDSMELATNVLSPLTNTWKRRFGYALFVPKLDQGTPTGDQVTSTLLYGTGFDGATGYVSTPNTINETANGNLSVEFWFATNSTIGGYFISLNNNAVLNAGDVSNFGVILNTTGTISVYLFSSGGATLSLTTAATYNDGNPHQVDVSLSGTTLTIYVDGVSAATTTLANGIGTITNYFWRLAEGPSGGGAGRSFPAVSFLQSFLSHVSVWPVALTQLQVTNHYQALVGLNGSQSNYEAVVKGDSPSSFWYLTETIKATPPNSNFIVQSRTLVISGASGTVALGKNTTLGNTLFVVIATDNVVTPTLTDTQGNSYTRNPGSSKLYNFFAPVTTPGADTLNVAAAGAAQIIVYAYELFGPISSPLDGALANAASTEHTQYSAYSSPALPTAAVPDRVFSIVYSASRAGTFTTSIAPGTGFTQVGTVSTSGTGVTAGYQVDLNIAYIAAPNTGTFAGSWTSSTSGTWQGQTVAFTVAAVPAVTGTTAFDYVSNDNGTYTSTSPTPVNNATASISGSNPYTFSMSPGSTIPVGSLVCIPIFMYLNAPGSNILVNSVTDTNNNTWVAQTPVVYFTNASGFQSTVQLWTCYANKAISSGSPTTVSIALNRVFTPTVFYFNVNGIGILDQQAHATGNGTSITSGNITVTGSEFCLSLGLSDFTSSASGNVIAVRNGAANFYGYFAGTGTTTDTWTQNSSGNWGSFLNSYTFSQGYFLSESVIV
jgi:hypothetical protein